MPGDHALRAVRPALWLGGLASLLLLASPARAELQSRMNVAASALAARTQLAGQPLVLTGIVDAATGLPGVWTQPLEAALRRSLVQKKRWAIRPAAQPAEADDWRLGGFYVQGAQGAQLRLLLTPPRGVPSLVRSVPLDAADLPATELSPESVGAPQPPEGASSSAGAAGVVPSEPLADASGEGGQVVPTLPEERAYQRARASRPPSHHRLDLSVAYKAFYPVNSSFQSAAGLRQDGVSVGLSFNDVLLLDLDQWHAAVSGPGTLRGVDYYGVDLALTAPWRLGALTLYAGPGLRVGSLEMDDPALGPEGAGFGNNGLTAVAGAKLMAGRVGVDLRYSYDLASSYTGYHTARLGVLYEFGR